MEIMLYNDPSCMYRNEQAVHDCDLVSLGFLFSVFFFFTFVLEKASRVGVCTCMLFVCVLVGSITPSSESAERQDAKLNHTGLEANIWRVDLKRQTNNMRRSFLTS